MHAHSEPAQPVTGRQQRRRVQAVPFHASGAPMAQPRVRNSEKAMRGDSGPTERLWAHGSADCPEPLRRPVIVFMA